jgi:hypothetical protein
VHILWWAAPDAPDRPDCLLSFGADRADTGRGGAEPDSNPNRQPSKPVLLTQPWRGGEQCADATYGRSLTKSLANGPARQPAPSLFRDGFVVVSILVGFVVDDLQDLDEAEGGPKPSQSRLLVGIELGHGPSRLAPRCLVESGPEVQVDPAALELKLVDLALAVVLAAGLEREQFSISWELLQHG